MKFVIQFYRTINVLSLDIAAGAVISALFFARILDTSLLPYGLGCLGLTVWIIYTADHLLDARSVQGTASTYRHVFHQRNFNVLVFFLCIAALLDVTLSFFIRVRVFQWGLVLGAVVLIYLIIQPNLRVAKEPAGAILYSAGVLLPSLAILDRHITFVSAMVIVQFVVTALINLILFSWFDRDSDVRDRRSSLITILGRHSGNRLLVFLFILQGIIVVVLIFASPASGATWVLLLMNVILLVIFKWHNYFAAQDRYRLVGDAIFFVPLLCLFRF